MMTAPQSCILPPPGWACSLTPGHGGPCAASPVEPSSTTGGAAHSASAPRVYGFARPAAHEFDLELPSGSYVRLRKITKSQILKLNLIEVLDGFTPELLEDLRGDDREQADAAAVKALTDPSRSAKIFGPVDRVVMASVVCPKVVADGETTDDQVNVDDVELEDKLAIFNAAFGEQLSALKSVRNEPQAELRDLPASQDVQPATQ